MEPQLQADDAGIACGATTMNDQHLFALLNAAPGMGAVQRGLAVAVAAWTIYLVPVLMTGAWVRGDHRARRDLLQMLMTSLLALGVAQIVVHVWPHPRPFALRLGTQYLAHTADPSLPSDHVTVFWSLALAAFGTHRFPTWGFPLLAVGLVVGWSRVYLGVHFPFDVLAAFPVAAIGAAAAHVLRRQTLPVFVTLLWLYDRTARSIRAKLTMARAA